MEKRLFDHHADLTIDEIGKTVNKFIDENISYLENNNDLIKWTSFPSVFLESDNDKEMFVKASIYIDELFIPPLKKVKMVNTLASMLIAGEIAINKIDINSLYLLVDFFVDVNESEYQKDITIFGTPQLLENVRKSSLVPDYRKQMLEYILKTAEQEKVDYRNMKQVRAFQKKINSLLKSKSCYDILGVDPYMQISHADVSKFGH